MVILLFIKVTNIHCSAPVNRTWAPVAAIPFARPDQQITQQAPVPTVRFAIPDQQSTQQVPSATVPCAPQAQNITQQEALSSPELCRHFARGHCRYGDSCTKSHVVQPVRTVSDTNYFQNAPRQSPRIPQSSPSVSSNEQLNPSEHGPCGRKSYRYRSVVEEWD
jgi:hypothetical protein